MQRTTDPRERGAGRIPGLVGTAVLIVVVAGLWGLLQVLDEGEVAPGPGGTESPLDGRNLMRAERIKIRSIRGGVTMVFERKDGVYEIVEPLRDLASEARLRSVSDIFEQPMIRVHEPETVDADLLEQTGLAEARGELEATWEDHTVRLELGDDGPLGHEIFVRKNGVIYHASKGLFSSLEANTSDFRERRVFKNTLNSLEKMTVRRRNAGAFSNLVVGRRGRALWIEEPIEARADFGAAASFVNAVLGLLARDFAQGNPNDPEPEPDYEIVVEGLAGREAVQLYKRGQTALVGRQQPRDLAFMVGSAEMARGLEIPARQLRSRTLNPYVGDDLVRVVLDPGAGRGAPAVLRRGAGNLFEVDQPVRAPTNKTATAVLLEGLTNVYVEQFVDSPGSHESCGLAEGAFRVEIVGRLNPRPIVLLLGKDEGLFTYARRTDEKYVVKVLKEFADKIRQAWPAFVSRDVYRVNSPARIQRLHYSVGEKSAVYVRNRDDGTWRLDKADGEPVPDTLDLDEVRDELADLRAAAVLDPAEVGELTGAVRIDLQETSGMSFATFEFFPRKDGALVRKSKMNVLYKLRERLSGTILAPVPQ